MQDIHSIGGGRFFAGGGAAAAAGAGSGGGGGVGVGGDRRLKPHHHLHNLQHLHNHSQQQQQQQHQAQPQALKCPRCDSANTKFCYYNNYNLSQPRHFCKSCRRYWTKGGVLRNVPVGGGCRKTKRSKHKSASTAAAAAASAAAAAAAPPSERKSPNSHSSSESSSLTAGTNSAAASATATEAVSAAATVTAVLEGGAAPDCGGLFTEIGAFSNLMAPPPPSSAAMQYEFGTIADVAGGPFAGMSWNHQSQKEVGGNQEIKVEEIAGGVGLMADQTAQVDLSVLQQDRSNGGGFGSLGNWHQCGDQGLFDLTNGVDQSFWSQNQWNDQDHQSLYLP